MPTEAQIQTKVDQVITQHRTTAINYYAYVEGITDIYKQRTKTFAAPVELIGRAILNPTQEKLTVIGSGERYDIAFLFSRLEMIRKFPSADEGEWLDVSGEFTWWDRRYKISRVAPTGQVGLDFSLLVALGMTIQGQRD